MTKREEVVDLMAQILAHRIERDFKVLRQLNKVAQEAIDRRDQFAADMAIKYHLTEAQMTKGQQN